MRDAGEVEFVLVVELEVRDADDARDAGDPGDVGEVADPRLGEGSGDELGDSSSSMSISCAAPTPVSLILRVISSLLASMKASESRESSEMNSS